MLSKKQIISIGAVIFVLLSGNALADITMGICYVGGREIERTDKPGDTVWVEQAMVHTLIPSEVTGDPIVMVPGLGLGGYIYLSTPDGRKGWAQLFAEAGHPVYVYDIPEYSTSGGFNVNKCNDMVGAIVIDVNDPNNPVATLNYPIQEYESVTVGRGKGQRTVVRSPQIPPTYGYYSTNSTNRNIWKNWGFGEGTDLPFPDVRFPVDYMEQFVKHFPLRYQDLESEDEAPQTGNLEAENIIPLCEKIGRPVILMLHSAAAAYLEPLLNAKPELFKSVINIEQAFITDGDAEDVASLLTGKPLLSVYADYIEARNQTARKELSQAITDAILSKGGIAGFIDLPAQGIMGNTHLMMQDNNNDVIADQIIDWLSIHVPTNNPADVNNL